MTWRTKLGALAAERQWSLRRLAAELGVHHSQVARVVAGTRAPTLALRERVRRTFPDYDPDRLIWWDDEGKAS